MFWRRFNTRGALWSIYGGLISSLGLVFFSPVMSGKGLDPVTGKNLSLLPTSIDISWFPLENPGIVSIPLGFLLGYLGTITSKETQAVQEFDELEVRALTGAGDWDDAPFAKWFVGGSSTPRYNCVDRHVEAGAATRSRCTGGRAGGDTRDITYADLQREVSQGRQRADRPRAWARATRWRSTCR
jgi:hypothetical protein